jgi:hypothetical protein
MMNNSSKTLQDMLNTSKYKKSSIYEIKPSLMQRSQRNKSEKGVLKCIGPKLRTNHKGCLKRPDPLELKCETITSPRRLVNTFLTLNST